LNDIDAELDGAERIHEMGGSETDLIDLSDRNTFPHDN
jgi:hypothetical protein